MKINTRFLVWPMCFSLRHTLGKVTALWRGRLIFIWMLTEIVFLCFHICRNEGISCGNFSGNCGKKWIFLLSQLGRALQRLLLCLTLSYFLWKGSQSSKSWQKQIQYYILLKGHVEAERPNVSGMDKPGSYWQTPAPLLYCGWKHSARVN